MTPEEIIKSWHDDSRNHGIIYCHVWSPFSRGSRTVCEGCGCAISAWPIVIEESKRSPLFHLLCREKCMGLSVKVSGPIKFGRERRSQIYKPRNDKSDYHNSGNE